MLPFILILFLEIFSANTAIQHGIAF